MAEPKDWWDKADIGGKIALPVVIAGPTIWFNAQTTERQENAKMVEVAARVLSAPADEESDPLREWAVSQLQENGGLTDEAGQKLLGNPDLTISVPWNEVVDPGSFAPGILWALHRNLALSNWPDYSRICDLDFSTLSVSDETMVALTRLRWEICLGGFFSAPDEEE